MKFAIPTINGELCIHFGHCEVFTLIDVNSKTGKIISVKSEIPPVHEPGVLPKWLSEIGVDHIIASGMGMRAQELFSANKIKVIVGATSGKPKDIVSSYLDNTLAIGSNACDH